MLEKRGLDEIGDNKLENDSTGKLMVPVTNKGIRITEFNSFGFRYPSMKKKTFFRKL